MKTRCATMLVLALLLASYTLSAAQKKSKPNPPYALARGFANLMFGWCEIPRGIIYENARIPIVGFAVGPVKGGFLTIWRELAGAVDILAMGLTREGLYSSQVPDFVWDAEWIPPCGEDIVSVENLTSDPYAAPPKSKCRPRRPRGRETSLRGRGRETSLRGRGPHHAKPLRRERTHHLAPRHGAPPDGRPRRKPDSEAQTGPRNSQTNPVQDTKPAPFNLGPEGDCGDRLKSMELQISALERRVAILR